MRGVDTWTKGTETVMRGLEVILLMWRLQFHFCVARGASAPPPVYDSLQL